MLNRVWREALPYLITLALVLLFYAPLFQRGHAFVLADELDQNVPNRVFAGRALMQGRLPHWTEAVAGGFPFLSDPQSAVFFPPNLLLAALYPDPGKSAIFDKFALGHVLLLALGMVFLARSLGLGRAGAVCAAMAVALNGYSIKHFSHTVIMGPIFCGLWGCGCLVRALRNQSWKWSIAAGLCFASSILGGHWQTALFALYAAGVGGLLLVLRDAFRVGSWGKLKTGLLLLGVPFVIGAAGSAVQVLPTLLLLDNSDRSILTPERAYLYSWPLRQLAGLFLPSLYQPLPWRIDPALRFVVDYKNWGDDGSFEYLMQAGFVTIGFAVFGWLSHWRRGLVQCLFFGSLFILICSLGSAGGLYPLLYHFAPGFKQVRIPPRLMWIAAVGWGLLAGLGIDEAGRHVRTLASRKAALITAGFIAMLMAAGACTLLIAGMRESDWYATFQRLFVSNPIIIFGVDRSREEFVADIWTQVGLGVIVCIALCTWLIVAGKMQSGSVLVVSLGVLLLCLELGAYGFMVNIGLRYPGYTHATEGSFFDALMEKPNGRIIATYIPPWGKNGGLVSGDRYARGYNPMTIRWVQPFLPEEGFPNGAVDGGKELDEFNVTRLVWQPSNVEFTLRGTTTTLPWVGFVELGAGDPIKPPRMEWKLDQRHPVDRLHLVSTAGCAAGLKDGTEIARATLFGEKGETITTFPLRAGIETAEWTHDNPENPKSSHSMPANSFVKPLDSGYAGGRFCVASLDVPSSAPVARVEITATAGAPTFFCVSHAILEYGGVVDARLALEALGWRMAKSRKPEWYFARRQNVPGWAWMVPEAKAVSYKEEFKWVKEYYLDPTFDLKKLVLLNKAQETEESAAKANAPDAKSFGGKAELKRGERPEEFSVATESNQRGWLVISQTWYPGWTATIDGKPADIVQANGPHLAIAVPEGKHRVEMRYYTPRFALGACVSGVTWLVAILFLMTPTRKIINHKEHKENRTIERTS